MSLFQYMIGNTDWSIPALHNVVLMQANPGDAPVSVPYDFDWCGLVNADYAVPAENLPIKEVTERVFRGICRTEEEIHTVLEEFRGIREDVYALIDSVPGLREKEKEKTMKFIRDFYEIVEDPGDTRREFMEKCRTE
jgi:hypothetical protein